jgi:hypothetical protein
MKNTTPELLARLELAVRTLDELQALYHRLGNNAHRDELASMISKLLERIYELRGE